MSDKDPNETLTFYCDDTATWIDLDGHTHRHTIMGCGAWFSYKRFDVDADFNGDGAADCPECGMFVFVDDLDPL